MDGVIKGMKPIYKNEHASCEVLKNHSLGELEGVLELVKLYTDEASRRNGYASELMLDVCDDADITGTVLMLRPVDGMELFYSRFGFARIQTKPVTLMARMPQIYKVKMNPISAAAEAICNV